MRLLAHLTPVGIALLLLAPGCASRTSEHKADVPAATKPVVVEKSKPDPFQDLWPEQTSESEIELRRSATRVMSDTLGRVLYLGRLDGYDYFEVGANLGIKRFKIPDRNTIVRQPMPYGSKPLRVGPFAEDRWLP